MNDVSCAPANRNWFHIFFHFLTPDLSAGVEKQAFPLDGNTLFTVSTKSQTT